MSEKKEKEKNIVVRMANQFYIEYPDSKFLDEKEKKQIQTAITNGGIVIGTKTYINSNNIPKLLSTDSAAVQIILTNAPKDDVKQYGDTEYLSTPETQKEIAKRKEQPHTTLHREKLDYASKCLDAFSGNSELTKERNIQNNRITQKRASLGRKIINDRKSTVSELSGEPLNGNGEVHHINRVAEKPEEALEDNNLMVLTQDEHIEFHRNPMYTKDKKGLEKFAQDKRKTLKK